MRHMTALLFALVAPALAYAHHSFAEFDQGRTVEVSGTLTDVAWQNPHVKLKVESQENGKTAVWDIECHSVGVLSRFNLDPKTLKVGDKVSIAGNPSKASANRMFGTNVLFSSGQEIVLAPGIPPRWRGSSAVVLGAGGPPPASTNEGPPTPGLFKTWGSSLADPEANPRALWTGITSLTPAAEKALAAWDGVHQTVARGCEPKGMPTIMEQPYGIAFEDRGATIAFRIEEYDTLRTIHMSDGSPVPAAKSLLGYSVGKWDGATLVVTTTGLSWPYISPDGLPQGASSRLEERFTPSADGKRLGYTLTITDEDTFTKPVVLKRAWIWSASERVRPYDCGQRQ